MKKGLSPIVSAILILLIAISVTLLAIIWLPKFIIKIFPQLGFNESYVRSRGCLSIENVKGLFGLFTIKNCGKVALSDFSFFIDSNFINKLNIGTLEPSQTIDFYDMPITGGRHSLYITADYAESPPYAVDVPYWECIGGEPILVEDWYVSKTISCICSYNTVIPVNGNVYVIENGRLSLYNCILQFEYMRIRDNGFLNLTKTKIRSIDGDVAFLDDSDVYILDSVFNQVSTWFEHASNATVINSKLYGIRINSNIHHKITFSDFDATNSPITEFVKAEDSNFTLNLTNVSFDYSSLQISDNSNTTVRNSAFSDFYIASEENHNLTVNNWNEDTTQDLYFKAQGSDFTFDAKNFYGGWTLFYGVDNSNNTVTNSNIGQLEAYDNSINTFINSSIDTVYLFRNTINTFKNSNLNSNFFVGTRWEDSDNFVKANFSNTTISNSISFDTSYYFPSRTSNITIFGNVTFDSSAYIDRFYANVTRNLPTIIKDSYDYPFPTLQPARINITNKFNQSVWVGSVSGGVNPIRYYIEDLIILFNSSNYGPGNFNMTVSQVCENKTDINFLNSTPLELTIPRAYDYDGISFSTPQVAGTRCGIAFDNLNFSVASSNGYIYKYRPDGTYVSNFNSRLNGLRDVASNGTYLWLLNYNSSERKVYRYLPSGTYNNWYFNISTVLEPYAVDFDGNNFWVLGNTSVYKYNITGGYTGFSFNLNRLQTPLYYPDIVFSGGLWILTNTSSTAKGSGVFRYKTDGTYDNWYFEVAPTVNTGRGLAYNGTYFWVMNETGNVYRYSLNKNCLENMKQCDEFITFLPYTISKNNTRYCLLYSLYVPSQTAITFANNVQNSSLDCQAYNINGNGAASTVGIYLTGANNNTINNCKVTGFNNGINIFSSSNNVITNTNSNSNGAGIVVTSSSNNAITNCSINGNINNDYYLASLGMNNNFINTNFTDYRTIYFYDSTSWFNYANSSTSMLTFGDANVEPTSDSDSLGWTDIVRFQATGTGNINKLTLYCWIKNGNPKIIGAIYSDNSGAPGTLLGVSNEITVPASPQWVDMTGLNVPITNGAYYWIGFMNGAADGDLTYTKLNEGGASGFMMADVLGSYPNPPNPFGTPTYYTNWIMSIYATYTPNIWLKTSVSAQATITRKLVNWNNTLMQWNDTSSATITARYNVTGLLSNVFYLVYNNSFLAYTLNSGSGGQISFTIYLPQNQQSNITVVFKDIIPPLWFSNSTSNIIAGNPTLFSLDWTDDFGLSGYIFSTNNSGTWHNDSFVDFENQTGNVIFYDGFESGDFSAWTTTDNDGGLTTVVVQSSVVHHGSYAASISGLDTAGDYGIIIKTFASTYTTLYGRVYVQFTQDFNNGATVVGLIQFRPSTGGAVSVGLQRQSDGTYRWLVQCYAPSYLTFYSAPFSLQLNTWYCLELKGVDSPTIGEMSLWINGVSTITQTGLNTGANPFAISWVEAYQETGNANAGTIYFDRVVVSDSYIGPDTGWSNVTKTLNSTSNTLVQWCVYANDTSNNWNYSSCINPFSLTTTFDNVLNLNFNEANGTIVHDKSLYRNDGIFYGETFNNGVFNGETFNDGISYSGSTPTDLHTAFGKYGKALLFDGVNDFVNSTGYISRASILSNGITFTAWIKTNTSAIGPVVGQDTQTGCSFYCLGGLYVNYVSGKASMMVYNGTAYIDASSSKTVNDNQWHFIVGTYNISNYTEIYVDGVKEKSSFSGDIYGVSPKSFIIGLQDILKNDFFNGTIDEVRILNRTLSTAEIQAEMLSSKPVQRPVASYSFEEPASATYVNDSHIWVNGTFGSALSFDGTNDYASVPTSTSIEPAGGMTQITMEAWVYVSSMTNNYQVAVMKGNLDAEIDVRPEWNAVRWGITNVSNVRVVKDTNVGFVLNRWFHLAITYDGSNIKLYVNGTYQDSMPHLGKVRSSGNGLLLGVYSNDYWFNGVIDEVRIYNRSLSQVDIQVDMNSSLPISRPVASYRFEEKSGQNAFDTHIWVNGTYGSALSFDGVDDYVDFGNTPSLSTTSLTVMFWLNLSSDPDCDGNNNWRSLIRKGGTAGTPDGWDVVLEENRYLQFDIGNGTSYENRLLSPSGIVPINQWVHLAFVYNKDTGDQIIYKNGTLNVSRKVNGFMQLNSQPVQLSHGANAVACPNEEGYINGAIDEVRIWSRALNSTEINAEMNKG